MASEGALSAPLIGTAASSVADPFYIMRDALEAQIQDLRVQHMAWRSLVDTCNTATDIKFKLKHDEFNRAVNKTEEACNKVKKSLEMVTKARGRFAHIDDRELAARAEALAPLEQSVREIKSSMNSAEVKGKFDSDRSKELHARSSAAVAAEAAASNPYARSNAEFMSSHTSQMQEVRREQDAALTGISSSLTRVSEMAHAISDEIKEQDVIIDDTSKEMDVAQGKMDAALESIQKLLKTKDKWQLITICSLVLVFVIVAIVAFYLLSK